MNSSAPPRTLGLDLLRLVAVMLVLFRHASVTPGSPYWLRFLARGGWSGVDLFFVLSGFLVSGILFQEEKRKRTVDIGRFLIRRGFKINRAFWLFILVSVAVFTVSGQGFGRRQLVFELFFVQNYLPGLWPHTWSLAVEEHFYFGIACLMWFLARPGKPNRVHLIPWIFAGVATGCLAMRLANLWIFPVFEFPSHFYATHVRVDSLFFGVLLSYLHHYRGWSQLPRAQATGLAAVGCLLFAPIFFSELERDMWVHTVGVILLYAGSGCLVWGALTLNRGGVVVILLGKLGAASYSTYLWHLAVEKWVAPHSSGLAVYLCVYIGGSLALGYLMNALIERPALALRENLFGSFEGEQVVVNSQ